jgi:VCBS repeat-containing protein
MSYFRELPDLEYQSPFESRNSSDAYVRAKNLFRRVKLRDDLQNVFTLFNKYQIQDGARPDTVAEELYGKADLDWVVLLTAGIVNVRDEWPLSDRDIYNYAEEIYGTELNAVHHYETREVKDSKGRLILPAGNVVDSFFKLPYPSNDVSTSFNSSAITINSLNASGVILSPLNTDNITSTSDYGLFTININALTWNYTFNTESLLKIPYVNGIANVSDSFSYTTIDGLQRNVTIKTRIESNIVLSSQKSTSNVSYVQYFDSGYNRIVTEYNIVKSISNYEYEVRKNNKKRSIYILKKEYLQQYLNDMRKIMYYDKSSQYVDKTLIRTENTRVTMP